MPKLLPAAALCAALVFASRSFANPTSAPAELSDADLQRRATAGSGDAAFTLAERLSARGDKAATAMYLLAAKLNNVPAMTLLLAKNAGPDGKPIDKAQQLSLLKRLVSAGSIEHHVPLRDASVPAYWSIATTMLPKTTLSDPALRGRPQQLTVRIASGKDGPLVGRREKVAPKVSADVPIDVAAISGLKVQTGYLVQFGGYVGDDDKFHAVVFKRPDATFRFDGRLIEHGVGSGREQDWEVEVIVKNTGPQPIKRVKIDVRCYQDASPNNEHKSLEFKSIPPGESLTQTATFRFYNFLYVGRSSVPKIAVKEDGFEW